ncbi:VOC family protein [Streptomyces cylindrosporus]|uniref:VOC family protein n=1 Tax=Streptomyces cylindrosporus TaxID=2927583 RepID=A0ABS9YMY4_9ACTN|nr:VOC family protein [Streptomyces cylindrosporus]MCI3278633.1 VOC family protein [Streptomyces cylindrosporus]
MNIDFHEDGAPAWVELSTPDAEVSTGFYGQLFGWTFAEGFGGQPQSWLAELGGRPAAAVTATPGAGRGSWTTFVNVTDAAKAAEKITAAGGSVLSGPRSLGTAGRSAEVADHARTRFGLWEAGEHRGFGVAGEPGAFHGGELITDDVEASAAFYGPVFGWTLGEPYGPLNRRDLQLGGRSISVLLPRPPAMPAEMPPYWDAYFTVADAARTADAAVRLGATVLMPATATEHGAIAVLADPTGAVFTALAPTH